MLNDLLEHRNFGNQRDLNLVLFQALNPNLEQNVSQIISYSSTQFYALSRTIRAILTLLEYIGFIEINDSIIRLNKKKFNPFLVKNPENYFCDSHFFDNLFDQLTSEGRILELFNENNLKFNHDKEKFYLLSHLIPLELFPIRNLLLSLNFVSSDDLINDHLYISEHFTHYFSIKIVPLIQHGIETKKLTLSNLKEILDKKQEVGIIGEKYVLEFEQKRLINHRFFDKIKIISETNVAAGYDILSFQTLDSFLNDRFIEVKSYENSLEFYWSKNEVEVAKNIGSNYFLYLVNRSQIKDPSYSPMIIPNPYEAIFSHKNWKREIQSWKFDLPTNTNPH